MTTIPTLRTLQTVITAEALVAWAWQRECVGAVLGRGIGMMEGERAAAGIRWAGASADGVAAVERVGSLGCFVDGGGPVIAPPVHPDAERVWEVVQGLGSRIARSLVVEHARTGGRPEWYPGARVEWRAEKRGGRDRLVWDGRRCVGTFVECVVSVERGDGSRVVRADVLPETIGYRRGLYGVWWDALAEVEGAVRGRLVAHRVEGVGAPREPWGIDRR